MRAFVNSTARPWPTRRACTPSSGLSRPTCKLNASCLKLYLITDRRTHDNAPLLHVVREALVRRPGVTILQMREKEGTYVEKLRLGRELREVSREAGIPLIVNDDAELALAVEADGVHLGQDDVSPVVAREMLGEGSIIGMSAGNVNEAEIAMGFEVDYIGTGPVFGTKSKKDAGEAIGVEGLRRVAEFVDGRVPIVAIGGIGVGEVGKCVEVDGVEGVAVVGAIMASDRVSEAVGAMAVELLR